jgi:hypothetical protein
LDSSRAPWANSARPWPKRRRRTRLIPLTRHSRGSRDASGCG